jgi:hypothetical protein
MNKNQCNKLKIFKSEDGYRLEWLFDDQLLYSEKYLIGNQELKISEIIEHKKYCCLDINEEDFAIIEENFNSPMVIGINDSIENLRSGAVYELSNKTFTYWEHNSPPPSWDEIILNMNRLQQEIT